MSKDLPFLQQLSALENYLQEQSGAISTTRERVQDFNHLLDFISDVKALNSVLPASFESGELTKVDLSLMYQKRSKEEEEKYTHLANFVDSMHDDYKDFIQLLKETSARETLTLRTPDGRYTSIAVGHLANNINDYLHYVVDEYQNKENLQGFAKEPGLHFSELLAIYRDELWKKDVHDYDSLLSTIIGYVETSGTEIVGHNGHVDVITPNIQAKPVSRLGHLVTENSWYHTGAVEAQQYAREITRYTKFESNKFHDMFAAANESAVLTDSARAYIHKGIKELTRSVQSRSSGQER